MGITKLSELIYRYAPASITYKSIKSFKGCRLAIDTNIFLYKIANIEFNTKDLPLDSRCILYLTF